MEGVLACWTENEMTSSLSSSPSGKVVKAEPLNSVSEGNSTLEVSAYRASAPVACAVPAVVRIVPAAAVLV